MTTISTYVGNYCEVIVSRVSTTTRKYYYAGGIRVAEREIGATTNVYFLVSDHLGSTSYTTNLIGTWVRSYRYKPWGEWRQSSGNTPTSMRYTGQRQEADLGLYYYGAMRCPGPEKETAHCEPFFAVLTA